MTTDVLQEIYEARQDKVNELFEAGKFRLSIKWNNVGTRGTCPICATSFKPDVGPELFLLDTWYCVCWDCAERVSPELLAMLKLYQATGIHYPFEFEKWEECAPLFERAVKLLEENNFSS